MSVGELDVFSQPAMRHGQIPQNIRLFTWVTTPQLEDQDYQGTQGTVDRMETTQSDVERRPYRVDDRGEGHGDDRSWRTNHLRTTSFSYLFLTSLHLRNDIIEIQTSSESALYFILPRRLLHLELAQPDRVWR